MQNVFLTSTAINEQNLSNLACFTEAAEAIAMLSRFSRLLFVVHLDLIFAWFARLRDSNFKMRDSEIRFNFFELEIPRLQFETPRFRDPPKICRDPSFFKDHSKPLTITTTQSIIPHKLQILFQHPYKLYTSINYRHW